LHQNRLTGRSLYYSYFSAAVLVDVVAVDDYSSILLDD
jgi:hypothetical protein